MLKKKNLALFVAAALSVTTVYAATQSSNVSEIVVGFKPIWANTTGKNAVHGSLMIGRSVTIKPEQLGYTDRDGDLPDYNATQYRWLVDGQNVDNNDQATFSIPLTALNKELTVEVTPVSISGHPLVGNPILLSNLATIINDGNNNGGSNDNGTIGPNDTARPAVRDLNIAGMLQPGKQITATYIFDAKDGHPEDNSIYAWGIKGKSIGLLGSQRTNNGDVPAFDVTPAYAGEVLEVTVRAINGGGNIGNTLTVGTDREVGNLDENGDTLPEDPGSGKNPGLEIPGGGEDGKVPHVIENPASVEVQYTSTANVELNGFLGRFPVAGEDWITAKFTPVEGGSSDVNDYIFTWKTVDDNETVTVVTSEVGKFQYLPRPADQKKSITVEVAHKDLTEE